jgi:hypothetical protein
MYRGISNILRIVSQSLKQSGFIFKVSKRVEYMQNDYAK